MAKNFGINAILDIYSLKLFAKGAILPLFLTFIIVILFCTYGNIEKDTLNIIVNLILSVIPSLLGFVLSGYALLIGFGNIKVIATKPKTKEGDSTKESTLYQKVSAVFAIGLLIQIFLLVFTYVIKLILKIDLPCLVDTFGLCDITNHVVFTILVFSLLYVTVMIKDLVVNIFNFSQVQHLSINKLKENDEGGTK